MSESGNPGRTSRPDHAAAIVEGPPPPGSPGRLAPPPVLEIDGLAVRLARQREPTRSIREYVIRLMKGRRIEREEFWPVRDVSLTVREGEILGIIGPNGAGKSTLLKVIAGIIPPSTGVVVARGRIAPLIELGAGFDAELTGRENIFLYGALLGFSPGDLEARFARIVEFAEMAAFIDVPLKNYSVGMSARLGFAIATDVKPDLLLMDEIFSVGDAPFQKKCEARMEAFRAKGVAMLLVSHDLDLIRETCHRTLFLKYGRPVALGPTGDVVAEYQRFIGSGSSG